ncbi:hypothetical protein C8R43DRAFT_242718 [Mycena crocata]|nr:hypothetical protein C8R43DRAFT_242718 [Mycena crocata]
MSFSQLQNGRNMPPPSTQYPIESERYSSVLESRSMSQSIAGSEGRSLSRVSAREEYSDLRRVYVGGQQGNSKPGGDHSLRRSSSVSIHAPQQSRRPASVYSGQAAGQNRQTRRQSNSSYVSEGQQSSTHIQGPPVQPTQFNQEEVSRARISDFKAQWEASQRTSDWARRQNIPPAQPSPPRPLSHATHERTNQQSRQQSPLADRHPHNSDQQNRHHAMIFWILFSKFGMSLHR